MDFEKAAQRLARDQSKIRGRHKGGITISTKARQQVAYQRKQQERLRAELERTKRNEAYRRQYVHNCKRSLKEKSLGAPSSIGISSPLLLKATSIHGDGDKIALPPSVLQTLTSQNEDSLMQGIGGSPWTFRVGILNPDYEFPASPLIQNLRAPTTDDDDMSDNDDENFQEHEMTSYIDELRQKYLSYTHCTVVEFTQEEGHIGVPKHIAQALLDPENRHETNRAVDIPKTKTVDPAFPAGTEHDMEYTEEDTLEHTPGHLAWGAFEIPDLQLELTMLKLPKGTGCTLEPTAEAVRNNFYGLKDVKLVLEQSLIRTRATLSVGDTVSTWFRGTKFDLKVTKVLPSTLQAVTCINTDIEVEIGEQKVKKVNDSSDSSSLGNLKEATNENSGFRLGTSHSLPHVSKVANTLPSNKEREQVLSISLPPEPPLDQKAGVCTVQIRYSGGHGRRRFEVATAQVKDLFAFASSLVQQNERNFRLITRFPRRELTIMDVDQSLSSSSEAEGKLHAEWTLNQAGIQQGQEMFIIEGL